MAQTTTTLQLVQGPAPTPTFVINTARLTLSIPVKPWDLEALWHELPKRLDANHTWWHKSIQPTGYYPLLQLKYTNGMAKVLALGEAADRVSDFFPAKYARLRSNAVLSMNLPKCKLTSHGSQLLRSWDVAGFRFHVYYLVIGQFYGDRHYDFITANREEKALMVAELIREKISDLLVGIGWPEMKDRVLVKVKKVLDIRQVRHGQERMDAVSCYFLTNIHLPDWIGLGVGAEHGLGLVREER